MSGLFNWGSRNQQVNKLGSVQVQTSEFGVCVPVLFGANRLAAKLIDYLNFNVQNQKQIGGKGGQLSTGYEYFAAVLLLLWKNGSVPSDGIGNIYDAGGANQLTVATETFTIPGGGGSYRVVHWGGAFYYDEGVTYQGSYSATVNDYGSDGLTTISGYNTLPLEKVAGPPGALQYLVNGSGGSAGTYSFSAADAGKVVTITYAYTQTPTDTSVTSDVGNYAPAEYLSLSIFYGTRPQAAWGYLAGFGHSLDYPGLAMVSCQNMDLGADATVPSYNFEGLNGNGLAFGGGIMDCDPSAVINAILTDAFIGMGYPYVGSLTQLSNYCVSNGIFMSPYYDAAKSCSSVIEELVNLCNAECFSSWDGLLKFVPYGDTTVVGFSRTYEPVTQPLYDLDISDFLSDGKDEPLAISVPNIADNSNYMKLEFKNRASSYNVDTIDDINQASVNIIGLRPADTVTAHGITTAYVAQIVLNALLLRKSYPYRTFKFKLNQCWPHLELMDIVTVTHPNPAYGLVKWPVRIKELEEDEKTGELSVTAEDFPWGAGQPALYGRIPPVGSPLGGYNTPGDIFPPVIFESNDRISRTGNGEIWIGVDAPNANWGGCDVWLSADGGTNYKIVGTITQVAQIGTLLNSVSAIADPDTTSEFILLMDSVFSALGSEQMSSSSTAAADAGITLALVDNELICYSTVSAAHLYFGVQTVLSGYTRRGQYGTAVASHSGDGPFIRLNDAVFSFEYDPNLVGKTLYFKFTSFNLTGKMTEFLSDVIAYPFALTGKFGNVGKSITNNLTIDSIDGGSSATIRIYGPNGSGVPTVGDAGLIFPPLKPSISVPAASLTGKSYQTLYLINYNPNTGAYVLYTSQTAQLSDQALGMVYVGSVTTCASGGAGGAGGGGGMVSVTVSPSSATVPASGSQQYTAVVTGSANQACTWFVDSIAGGNSTVGTINSTGNYSAPSGSGGHTISAHSTATGAVGYAGVGVL